jgi:hypothetical protein
MCESDLEAGAKLERLRMRRDKLFAGAEISMEAEHVHAERERKPNHWLEINWAELKCLTLSDRPEFVAHLLREAMAEAQDYHRLATADRLGIYQRLGLFTANVEASMPFVDADLSRKRAVAAPRFLLFVGQHIDAAAREEEVRRKIGKVVETFLAGAAGETVVGIAGGATVTEILFHQVCQEKKIKSTLYLPVPEKVYAARTLKKNASPEWVNRFYEMTRLLEKRPLGNSDKLPVWLRKKNGYDVWVRKNLWMLNNALAHGTRNATLIAWWDGVPGGDSHGGTEHMIKLAQSRGVATIHLSPDGIEYKPPETALATSEFIPPRSGAAPAPDPSLTPARQNGAFPPASPGPA